MSENAMEHSSLTVEEHAILYLDILGFRSAISSMDENLYLSTIDPMIKQTLDNLKKVLRLPQGDVKFSYKMFSDNIVIAMKIPEPLHEYYHLDKEDYPGLGNTDYPLLFTSILIELAKDLQRLFIFEYNLFVRGAITVGTLYINDDYVFGRGLIKAYDFENTIARYPRIVIDDSLLEGHDRKTLRYNRLTERPFTLTDGVWFVDYLDIPLEDADQTIQHHKKIIEKLLHEHSSDLKIKMKYDWCRQYHNLKCKQMGYEIFIICDETIV